MQRTIRIGTRGSKLALTQARMVQRLLASAHQIDAGDVETVLPIEVIKTSGDRIQDRPLNAIGGKGLFTKEIEEALLASRIDIAVHSMKDMPTLLPEGLAIDCMLEREDPRDAFISPKAGSIAKLPEGAVVGSTSLRRQAQILKQRPDLKVVTYRGNVDTRLEKLNAGEVDATLLAMAGLNRLGLADQVTQAIPLTEMLPAPAQGVVGVERRADDQDMAELLAPLDFLPSRLAAEAERAALQVLDGSCRTPIGVHGYFDGDELILHGLVMMPTGQDAHTAERNGDVTTVEDAHALGKELGLTLRERAGEAFFEALSQSLASP